MMQLTERVRYVRYVNHNIEGRNEIEGVRRKVLFAIIVKRRRHAVFLQAPLGKILK
jgi:hypothetical protein